MRTAGPDTSRPRRYSGEIDVRPQSSHRRYSTGSDSERPITRAAATPHRGQTIAGAVRLAMMVVLLL
jgi:hypothetical protein